MSYEKKLAERPDIEKLRDPQFQADLSEKAVKCRKLSKMLFQGKRYCEPIQVKGIDNNTYELDVYVLSDEDVEEVMTRFGMNRKGLEDLQKDPKVLTENLAFQRVIAAKCVKGEGGETYTAEDLRKILMPLEYAKIFTKALQVAQMIAPTDMGGFRQKPRSGTT